MSPTNLYCQFIKMWTLWLSIFVVVLCHATDEELPPRPDLEPPPPLDSDMGVGKLKNKVGYGKLDGGDLILTEQQRDILYGEGPKSYGGADHYTSLWDFGIVPYEFRTGDFSKDEMKEIRKAMDVYEQETCIRFEEKSYEYDFVQLQSNKSGCYSALGDAGIDAQPLNLERPGCMQFGIYLHELGHALGLLHEHQLPTRDQYVKYFEENVDPVNLSELKKYAPHMADLYNTEYDLSSIMHYELTTFSKDGLSPTLGIENSFMKKHIGRRYSYLLSFGDVKILNRMYECHAKCNNVDCPEPGFINKKCECVTPEAYFARVCVDDPAKVAWCEKITKHGKCKARDDYQQRHCARTCDFCPRFLPGDSGLVKPEACTNHYRYSEKCDQWAAEGTCKSNPSWMKRYCRKSCNACNEQIGVCANTANDVECDGYANHWLWKYCTSSSKIGVKVRRLCPDSCKICPKS